CPIYQIQHLDNDSLNQIHPLSEVLQSSNIPFIHYCKSICSFQQHDMTDYEYIRNDFFFKAI
ncbi:17875_t:CDS:1, partial [Gigaspora margarita]